MMKETIDNIDGKKWRNRDSSPNMWQQEQTEMFASIRSGNPSVQCRLHVQEHDDGHHGPNGLLYGPDTYLGRML